MILTDVVVPFSYRFDYVPPRARNSRSTVLCGTTSIGIPTVTDAEAPVAFMWSEECWTENGKISLSILRRWYDNKLWMPLYKNGREDQQGREPVSLDALQTNLDIDLYGRNPFSMQDNSIGATEYPRREPNLKHFLKTNEWKKDQLRDLVSYEDEIVKRLNNVDILIVDDMVWVSGFEPRYLVQTFGMGNNHGGTSAFIETVSNPNLHGECYFNATEYDECAAYADAVATARGDDKSVPCRPESKIKV